MHIIAVNGKERDGAYSVKDDDGEQVLYIFQQEDDAIRYAMQLEDRGYPEMHVIEVEESENTLSILDRYIEESETELDKSTIQSLMRKIYQESCEIV